MGLCRGHADGGDQRQNRRVQSQNVRLPGRRGRSWAGQFLSRHARRHRQFPFNGAGEGFPPGEAYKKTPELAQSFVDTLPITDIPAQYVVFKPLAEVAESGEKPQVVVFYANPDQLSALVVLANYGRAENSVKIPFAAGCQSTCLLPWSEQVQEKPAAIVGMVDISARPYIEADLLSFSVPYSLFVEMESNAPGSFLDKEAWEKVAKRL